MSDDQNQDAPAQEREGTDWKAEARKWEQRAKDANSRVKELEPFQAKATELEEASKSDLEKALARAEKAEKALGEAQALALRMEVAAEKGVPVELLHGADREALEASADQVLAFSEARKGTYVPNEGTASKNTSGDDPRRVLARQIFAAHD